MQTCHEMSGFVVFSRCSGPVRVQLQWDVVRRCLANSNVHIVAPDLDVPNHAIDVDFVIDHLCNVIFDVIDHEGHGSCLFQVCLADVGVVGIRIFLSN